MWFFNLFRFSECQAGVWLAHSRCSLNVWCLQEQLLKKMDQTAKEWKEKERKIPLPSAHPAWTNLDINPGWENAHRACWPLEYTKVLLLLLPHPKIKAKKKKIQNKSSVKNVQPTDHQSSPPLAPCTPRSKNWESSEPLPYGSSSVMGVDGNSQLCSRLRMWPQWGRGGSGCFLAFGKQHHETQEFLQSLTSSEEGVSVYVIAVLT